MPSRWNPDRDGGCQHQSAPDKEHQQRRNGGWKVWCGHFRRLFSVGRFSGSHQLEASIGCSNLLHEVHASNECNVWTHRLDASSGCIDWTCHGLRNGRDPLMRRMFGACYEEVS
jgi:hypothetical protein